MKWLLVALLVLHGLLHFMGVAKAAGLAELPQLTQPIERGAGLVWLAAGLALLASAAVLVWSPRHWWMVGLVAVVLSQLAIATSWSDARFGTVANLIVLAAVAYGFASRGPLSFRAEYERDVRARLAAETAGAEGVSAAAGTPAGTSAEPLAEDDPARLPEPVRRYLHTTGAVGHPAPRHFEARWRGRIRATADDPWMEFTAVQHNFLDPPARFFLMDARRSGLPVDVYHAYEGGRASMRVRLLSAVPIVNAAGTVMDRAEAVTVFNDIALLAPGGLADERILWEEIDDTSARGHYTIGPITVTATLSFNEVGELVDFVSDDRAMASKDGTEFEPQRWSTPISEYRAFGPMRITARGEGRWHLPEGAFTYIELELIDMAWNPGVGPQR